HDGGDGRTRNPVFKISRCSHGPYQARPIPSMQSSSSSSASFNRGVLAASYRSEPAEESMLRTRTSFCLASTPGWHDGNHRPRNLTNFQTLSVQMCPVLGQ